MYVIGMYIHVAGRIQTNSCLTSLLVNRQINWPFGIREVVCMYILAMDCLSQLSSG
jgi:hypothetical protein